MADTRRLTNVQVPLRVTPAMYEALKVESERDDRSMAQVIRLAIREYLLARSPIGPEPRPSVQSQHDRIRELCELVHPELTAYSVCAAIVPESAERLMTFAEARTVIDTLEARKANRNGND